MLRPGPGLVQHQMWEYKVIKTTATGVPMGPGETHAEKLTSGFNELGKEGWELCGIIGSLLFFKRMLRV